MIWIVAYLASVVGAFLTIIVVTMMRNEHRHSVGRLGWLGLTLLSPPIGLVLFLLLGGRKISAEHSERDPIDMPQVPEGELEPDDPYEELLDRREVTRPMENNRIDLIETPTDHHREYLDLFASAEESIYVLTFTVHDDRFLSQMLDVWCEKARAGVDVNVMFDGFGSIKTWDSAFERLREAGGRAERFKPLHEISKLAYFNFRNHRKITVVDGRSAIIGGANLVGYQITDRPDDETWDDLSIKIEGPAVPKIQAVFCSDWNFITGEDLPPPNVDVPPPTTDCSERKDNARIGVLPVGPDAPQEILDDFWLFAINRAEDRIWIATPYFIPPPAVMRSLEAAGRRGVDVRVMVPRDSDLKMADWARTEYLNDLEECGINIYAYTPAMIHAKVGLIDHDVAIVGSTNFDSRSFFLNYELSVLLHDGGSIDRVVRWFEGRFEDCDQGNPDRSRHRRFFSTMARLFASEL